MEADGEQNKMRDKAGGLEDPDYYTNEHRQIEQIMGAAPAEDDLVPYGQVPAAPARTLPAWNGVVIIVRPEFADERSMCRVASARSVEFNGRRAITPFEIAYPAVKHFFSSDDGGEVYAYAEFYDRGNGQPGHLEFREKASQKEFFLTAGGVKTIYPSMNRVV